MHVATLNTNKLLIVSQKQGILVYNAVKNLEIDYTCLCLLKSLNWLLILREEHRLRVVENVVVRKRFGLSGTR
jgi:hypothetical protein